MTDERDEPDVRVVEDIRIPPTPREEFQGWVSAAVLAAGAGCLVVLMFASTARLVVEIWHWK